MPANLETEPHKLKANGLPDEAGGRGWNAAVRQIHRSTRPDHRQLTLSGAIAHPARAERVDARHLAGVTSLTAEIIRRPVPACHDPPSAGHPIETVG